jgi:GNAT superfamily N-acetyltransferase
LPLIAAVQAASWKDTYSGVLPKEYLTDQVDEDLLCHWREVEILPDDVVLVAEEDGIIGFIAVWCRPDPLIDNLHVKPSRRSNRIGSTLLISAVCQLLELGHRSAYLWVVASNERAIRFYTRLGGVCLDRAVKNIFGHEVPNIKIEWSDISVLCRGK